MTDAPADDTFDDGVDGMCWVLCNSYLDFDARVRDAHEHGELDAYQYEMGMRNAYEESLEQLQFAGIDVIDRAEAYVAEKGDAITLEPAWFADRNVEWDLRWNDQTHSFETTPEVDA